MYNGEVILSGSDKNLGRPVKLLRDYEYAPWKNREGVLGKVVKKDITYEVGDNLYAVVNEDLTKPYVLVFKDVEGNVECCIPVDIGEFKYLDITEPPDGTRENPYPCGTLMVEMYSTTNYFLLPETAGTVSIVCDAYAGADELNFYYSVTDPIDGTELLVFIGGTGFKSNTTTMSINYDPSISRLIVAKTNENYSGSQSEYVINCPY